MREILFRGKIKETDFENIPGGWSEQDGDWVEGLYHTRVDCVCNGYECCECDGYENHLLDVAGRGDYPIDPKTVGQYTGLTDKNEKKIFEGDIVKVNTGSNDNGYGEVEYRQCGCEFAINGFLDRPYRDQYHQRTKGEFCRKLQKWLVTEIIGNIHDNPELMETMRNYADFADSKNVQLQKQLDASEKSLKIIVEFLSEQRWADCIVNGCKVEDRCGSEECVEFVIGYLKEQEKEQEQ